MIEASMFVQPPPKIETIAAQLAELEALIDAHIAQATVRI